jgi:hypothetical protein
MMISPRLLEVIQARPKHTYIGCAQGVRELVRECRLTGRGSTVNRHSNPTIEI